MLRIAHLAVSVENKPIIQSFSLDIAPGTVHAIMGPNGSGKSTLAHTLVGLPGYEVTAGTITLKDQSLVDLSMDKRAQLGLFLAFQHPLAIPGVTVATLLKEAHQAVTGIHMPVKDFQALLQEKMALLNIPQSFMHRPLNDGFSGGEKKRLEILQMLILEPSVVVLDEIDSGLDIDALMIVSQAITQLRVKKPDVAVVMITHYQRMLNYLVPDYVHVMRDGAVVHSGDFSVVHHLEQHGYEGFGVPQKAA